MPKNGWRIVLNRDSGIFFKNGCYFVFSNHYRGEWDGWSLRYARSIYAESGINKINSFYMEKDGFILLTGVISGRLAEDLEFRSESTGNTWSELLDKINDLAESPDDVLLKHKRMPDAAVIRENGGIFAFDSSLAIKDTMLFGVRVSLAGLNAGENYGVTAIENGRVFATLLDNASGRFLDKEIALKTEDWRTLVQNKLISAVYRFCEPAVGRLVPLVDTSAELPEEFRHLSLSGAHYNALCRGVAKCSNVTPVLAGIGLDNSFTKALELADVDLPLVCECYTSGCEELVTQLMTEHLNLKRFIDGPIDIEYLKLQMSDFEDDWDAFSARTNYAVTDRVYARSLYSYGWDGNGTVKEVFIRQWAKRLGIESCAEDMLLHGTELDYGMNAQMSYVKDRLALLSAFAADGLVIGGRSWFEIFNECLNKAIYLGFHTKYGFLVYSNGVWFGRDSNSVFTLNNAFTPVWRGIRINERFYSYGDTSYFV